MSDWYPDPPYLCLLDPACTHGGHSVNCKSQNVKRVEVLTARERERRQAQMDADCDHMAAEADHE